MWMQVGSSTIASISISVKGQGVKYFSPKGFRQSLESITSWSNHCKPSIIGRRFWEIYLRLVRSFWKRRGPWCVCASGPRGARSSASRWRLLWCVCADLVRHVLLRSLCRCFDRFKAKSFALPDGDGIVDLMIL